MKSGYCGDSCCRSSHSCRTWIPTSGLRAATKQLSSSPTPCCPAVEQTLGRANRSVCVILQVSSRRFTPMASAQKGASVIGVPPAGHAPLARGPCEISIAIKTIASAHCLSVVADLEGHWSRWGIAIFCSDRQSRRTYPPLSPPPTPTRSTPKRNHAKSRDARITPSRNHVNRT